LSWLAQQPTWADMQAIPAGDPVAGRASYATCAACHGQQGEGNVAMNAPSLAVLPAWYIARQLEHFKHGICTNPPARPPARFITKYIWSQDHKVIAIQYGSLRSSSA
jgi:cytochrome c553